MMLLLKKMSEKLLHDGKQQGRTYIAESMKKG